MEMALHVQSPHFVDLPVNGLGVWCFSSRYVLGLKLSMLFSALRPLHCLQLLLFLREELCVKRNLTVLFRTWDTSTQYFHANATFYTEVTDAVPPHPKLVFAVKHTMLDFW